MTASPLQLALAQYLDFRTVEDPRLALWNDDSVATALRRNPTTPDTLVDQWLGVGRAFVRANFDELLRLLQHRPFSSAALDLLIRRDRRMSVLRELLRSQPLNHEQLYAVLTKLHDPASYEFAVSEAEYFHLAENPHAAAIVERSGITGRLYALAYRVLAPSDELAERWVRDYSLVHPSRSLAAWVQLVHRRPDLYDTLVAYAPADKDSSVLLVLAGSPYLEKLEHQRALLSLDLEHRTWRQVTDWCASRQYLLRVLVANPRCHREVLEELDQRLSLLDPRETRFNDLAVAVRHRLSTWNMWPRYEGDFSQESDSSTAKWLAQWFRSTFLYPAGSLYTDLPLQRDFLANPVLAKALKPKERKDVSRLLTEPGRRRADRGGSDPLWLFPRVLSVNDRSQMAYLACSLWKGRDAQRWHVFYAQQQLGSQWSRYETLLALSANWAGTFGQLVTTAKELN